MSESIRCGGRLGAVVGLLVLTGGCGGGDSSGGMIGEDPVTLLDVHTQVLRSSCALTGCHAGSGAPFGLDLSSVAASEQNLVGVPSVEVPTLLRVEPGNAADSYLYMKVVDDPRIEGDPMPRLGDPLGAADLALIESWIEQGAQ